jgi:hypothetical protein
MQHNVLNYAYMSVFASQRIGARQEFSFISVARDASHLACLLESRTHHVGRGASKIIKQKLSSLRPVQISNRCVSLRIASTQLAYTFTVVTPFVLEAGVSPVYACGPFALE